jgi:hypothetical protein
MFERVYGHHHPDFQVNAVNALSRPRAFSSPRPGQLSDRNDATNREQNGTKIAKVY